MYKTLVFASDKTRRTSTHKKKRINKTIMGNIPISYKELLIKNDGYNNVPKYCSEFDDDMREHIRNKHNRLCFICGKNEKDNGKRLSVHHVDMNKNQGCDGDKWLLIPLCHICHAHAHHEPNVSRIKYLLNILSLDKVII